MINYFTAIKTAIIIFPIVAFLFTIPFIISQYHRYGSIHKFRVLIIYSFILYLITIYFLVILPLPNIEEVDNPINEMLRLKPFSFVEDMIRESSFVITDLTTYIKALTEPCFYVVFFNILMTMPFGMYLRYYYQFSLKKTIICSFLLSLFFELTQLSGLYFIYKSPYRLFDVDDLLLNTLGGILGYLISKRIVRYLPTRSEIDKKSIEQGKEVSGLRRITIFFIDLVLSQFFVLILSIFFNYSLVKWSGLIIYFIIIPYSLNDQTLGSKFLNVKLIFPNYKLLRMTLRFILLYLYYLKLPFNFLVMINSFIQKMNLETIEKLWFYILASMIIFLFYLANSLILIKRKKIYYDAFLKVQYISTITEEIPDKP